MKTWGDSEKVPVVFCAQPDVISLTSDAADVLN